MATPLFIISGPSGTGKTTLCNRLLTDLPDLHRIITYTTRTPRPGEIDGKDYVFVTAEVFHKLVIGKQFLETNRYNEYWYGTHCELLERLNAGQACIIIPDINGAQRLVEQVPHTVTIWLDVSAEKLSERLRNRDTEDRQAQAARLLEGLREQKKAAELGLYQHSIDASDFEQAYRELKALVATSQ